MIGCNSQIAYKIHLGTLQEIVQHSESSYFLEWFWIASLSFTRRIIALCVACAASINWSKSQHSLTGA